VNTSPFASAEQVSSWGALLGLSRTTKLSSSLMAVGIVDETSPFHSLARRKAKGKRTVVLSPDFNS
jgi:hypothetical protein